MGAEQVTFDIAEDIMDGVGIDPASALRYGAAAAGFGFWVLGLKVEAYDRSLFSSTY